LPGSVVTTVKTVGGCSCSTSRTSPLGWWISVGLFGLLSRRRIG
jgi:MYXO-CTERM domain-containing protein